MTYESRLQALLGKGYFPKELPRAFTTSDFGVHAVEVLAEWRASKVFTENAPKSKVSGKKKEKSFNYGVKECSIEIISAPKKGHERRDIHLTHPIPQALLSHEISFNWATFLKYLSSETHSIDKLNISDYEVRGLSEIDFGLHRRKKAYIEAQSDWIVKTDITRYYPSIYTHSLAWACYGKENVKKNRNFYEGSLIDRVDQLIRAANRNQTVGIPVGPETSRIVAELIGRHVDKEVCSASARINPAYVDRLQDDWFVGTSDRETAEVTLAAISKCYRAYGLEINGSKTSLTQVGALVDDEEVSEIRGFLSAIRFSLSGYRLTEFINLVERMHVRNPKSAAISYAISVLEGLKFDRDDVENIESFLLKAALISPGSMARICSLLLNINFRSRYVSHRRIGQRVKELANRNAELGNSYELIWLLWILRGLRIKTSSRKISEFVEQQVSSSLSLILLDMRNQSTFLSPLPVDRWLEGLDDISCRGDSRWLLAYEGFRHGWLSDTKSLMSKPFFGPMATRNVVFYDPRGNVAPSKANIKRRIETAKRRSSAFSQFLLRVGMKDGLY